VDGVLTVVGCVCSEATQPIGGHCSSKSYFYNSCPTTTRTATVNLTFPNSGNDCELCGLYNAYICCYGGTYENYSATAFFDPLPSGSTLQQIQIAITSAVFLSSSNETIFFNLNNQSSVLMPIVIPEGSPSYGCGSTFCQQFQGSSQNYPNGMPTYNYGGYNALGWADCTNAGACFSEVLLTLFYTD